MACTTISHIQPTYAHTSKTEQTEHTLAALRVKRHAPVHRELHGADGGAALDAHEAVRVPLLAQRRHHAGAHRPGALGAHLPAWGIRMGGGKRWGGGQHGPLKNATQKLKNSSTIQKKGVQRNCK